MAFEDKIFEYFFAKFTLSVAMASNSDIWTKLVCFVEDYARKTSVKFLSKYLMPASNKCQYTIYTFPIISQWKLQVAIATKVHEQRQ